MKEMTFAALVGILGAGVLQFFGGWENVTMLAILCGFMTLDYISGVIIAAWKKRSPKSCTGKLNSNAGFKGICKKGVMLLIVLACVCLDFLLKTRLATPMICFAFSANELLSLFENAKLLDINVPDKIMNMVETIRDKGEQNDNMDI